MTENPTTIPDHIIDKAARALAAWDAPDSHVTWDEWGDEGQAMWHEAARAAFSAVADDLRAEAFDEGAEYGWLQTGEGFNGEYANGTTHDGTIPLTKAMGDDYTNPYRQEQNNE